MKASEIFIDQAEKESFLRLIKKAHGKVVKVETTQQKNEEINLKEKKWESLK